MENAGGCPGPAHISAARNENVVKGGRRTFLQARLAGSIDVIDIMRKWIGDNGALVVVEGRVARGAILTDDRVPDLFPRKAVVVRTLDVNQRAAARVVIGDPDVR